MAATTRVGVKDDVKMMESRAEIDAGQSHLSKCEAGEDSCGREEKIYIKIARLYLVCPQRQRRKKKIERENSRRGDSRVRQWTAPGGGGVTERRRCSQQENREGEKKRGKKVVCLQSPAVSLAFKATSCFSCFVRL